MTHPISDQLSEASRRAIPVVRAVPDSALAAPTPCADYRVRDLLNHLLHVVVGFQSLAAKEPADFTTTPDRLAEDGWRDRFPRETDLLVRAWAEPGAEDGVSPGMGLPQPVVGAMALLDLTVHAWDLARATGQDFAPDPDGTDTLRSLVDRMGPTARSMGVFGEAVPVPEDATAFEALLADTGRDPRWAGPAR